MGQHERIGAEAARRRAGLRARGLRLRQIWVPDLRDAEVRAALAAEVAAIGAARQAEDDLAFIDAVQHWSEDDPV